MISDALYRHRFIPVFLLFLTLQACRIPEVIVDPEPEPEPELTKVELVQQAVGGLLRDIYKHEFPFLLPEAVHVERIDLDEENRRLDIHMNERFSYVPFRPETTEIIYGMLHGHLPDDFVDYKTTLYTLDEPIGNLIPNKYRRTKQEYDLLRMPYADERRPDPVVRRLDRHIIPDYGLEGRQIALWHSHGWYYAQQRERWEWQRPRLFQTVEDLLPMSFTLPYLVPMLENAGAYVWMPRERDVQQHEAIVDFDSSTGDGYVRFLSNGNPVDPDNLEEALPGFGIGNPPYTDGENPFRKGSYRYMETAVDGNEVIRWVPDIPESGEFAVYVAYAAIDQSVGDVLYSVYHRGGRTDFSVNQTIGAGTWIYLGNFEFEEGVNEDSGRVELTNRNSRPGFVTADAVRFGGGMGNIEREGQTSGRPRYQEAARYYLQYAGMPDSLVYSLSEGQSDIVDDYQGRGEWVNYLKGAPYGPYRERNTAGLGIPVDLSLAFHTDAGVTQNDTVVGTLMIYSIEDLDSLKTWPDEINRLANRDFADIMQTEIVEEIRKAWDPAWKRRHLFNRMYSEAARPNVPAVLLELLSHQNFLDMQFAQDPRFRFDVSRTIYKSILKFLADRYQLDYVVQPLPVSNFRILPHGEHSLFLRWNPVSDSLEAGAEPDRYIVYKKRGEEPFDAGRVTEKPEYVFEELDPGVMYQFRVAAANDGGKSFPSETLAASLTDRSEPSVLIVNGFERVSGPAIVDEPGFKGFVNFHDHGVPDRYDLHFTGAQFDFYPGSEWRTNDAPGHGASYADYETRIIPGNRFDYPAIYGATLHELNLSFVSAGVDAIRDRQVDMSDFDVVILILGNQKSTFRPKHDVTGSKPDFQVFPARLQEEISRYLRLGGRMFISGSNVGSDVHSGAAGDSGGIAFINRKLGFSYETNHAARTGEVLSVSDSFLESGSRFRFNSSYHPDIYRVDAPDAIVPRNNQDGYGNNAEQADADPDPVIETLLRYKENHFSAAVGYHTGDYSVVTFGFPFETIIDSGERRQVLSGVLRYLGVMPENR